MNNQDRITGLTGFITTCKRVFTAAQIVDLYARSHPSRTTRDDEADIENQFAHANLVATAWADGLLIGVARAFTDFTSMAYLSDLDVDANWRRRGVGRQLIQTLLAEIKPGAKLLLFSNEEAEEFYKRVGFEPIPRGFKTICKITKTGLQD
jgi:GNAT superfamily N-acetyltransferase